MYASATTAAPAAPGPVQPVERVALLDALRGLALLGILIINLLGFTGYFELTLEQRASLLTASADRAAEFLMTAFARGKFYSLFSLLFGIGFAVQMLRAEQKGIDFAPRYRRRLAVLVGIGLVHLCVIWSGDILVLYALLGFLLIPLRRLPDRALLLAAAMLIVAPVLQHAVIVLSGGVLNPGGPLLWLGARIDAHLLGADAATPYLSAAVQGGWTGFVQYNLPGPVWRFGELLEEGRPFKVFAMFLVGFVAARRAIFHDPDRHRPLLRAVLFVGLAVGLVANLAMAYMGVFLRPRHLSGLAVGESALYAAGVAPLALAYAAAFALLWTYAATKRWMAALAPAGRMALTNYLLQSLVAIGIFYGIGLGWGGKLGPTLVVPLALLIFGAQLQLSAWWLHRFRFGPAEWLWRSLTYGTWQPLRLPAPVAAPAGPEATP
jgi:uncharacterized protein